MVKGTIKNSPKKIKLKKEKISLKLFCGNNIKLKDTKIILKNLPKFIYKANLHKNFNINVQYCYLMVKEEGFNN